MSSAALDAEPGFRMVEYRLLAENESVQVASQANALPPFKGNFMIVCSFATTNYEFTNEIETFGKLLNLFIQYK